MKNKSILVNYLALLFAVGVACIIGCNKSETPSHANCTKDSIEVSIHVDPYFDSFVEDCKNRDIDYKHIYCLRYIHLAHTHVWQGQTSFCDATIEINEELIHDSIGMKFVVYHELGHWLGLEHSDGIMKENYNSLEDMEMVRDNWDELSENFFSKIKNK